VGFKNKLRLSVGMFFKEITKNLLKENSCRNCKMNITGKFGEVDGCEMNIIVSLPVLKWKKPDIGICKRFIENVPQVRENL